MCQTKGSLFCGLYDAVEDVLNIPDHLRAFAFFPYGYPAESREQQNRYRYILDTSEYIRDTRRIHTIAHFYGYNDIVEN